MSGSVFFIPGSSHPGVAAPRSKPGLATAREFVAGEENALLHYVAENLLGARESHSPPTVRRSAPGDPLSTDRWSLTSLSVADTSLPIGCRPIVLYGPSGTGKSLLAHNLAAQHQSAIQHSTANQLNSTSQNIAAERKPASAGRCSTALYSGSDFVRAVVNAIDTDRVAEFRRKLRQTRFIIIDGLEELLTSAITQQELAHLLDACGEQRADVENQFDHQQQTAAAASQSHGFGNQLVITARELPVEIASLDRRLASRLMNGLCVPIQAPGPAARRVLLVRLSEWLGTSLTESAVDALADGVPGLLPANSTVLDINQVLIRLSQAEPGPEKPIGIERFTACSSQSDSPEVVLKRVVTEVARSFGVRVADMTGPSRRQGVVRARGVAMYLARHQMALSLDMIGQYFGNRDHTTVLHACRKTQRLCDSDDAVRDVIAKLETEFFNAIPSSPFTTRHRRS